MSENPTHDEHEDVYDSYLPALRPQAPRRPPGNATISVEIRFSGLMTFVAQSASKDPYAKWKNTEVVLIAGKKDGPHCHGCELHVPTLVVNRATIANPDHVEPDGIFPGEYDAFCVWGLAGRQVSVSLDSEAAADGAIAPMHVPNALHAAPPDESQWLDVSRLLFLNDFLANTNTLKIDKAARAATVRIGSGRFEARRPIEDYSRKPYRIKRNGAPDRDVFITDRSAFVSNPAEHITIHLNGGRTKSERIELKSDKAVVPVTIWNLPLPPLDEAHIVSRPTQRTERKKERERDGAKLGAPLAHFHAYFEMFTASPLGKSSSPPVIHAIEKYAGEADAPAFCVSSLMLRDL